MTELDPPHLRRRSLREAIEDKIIESLDAASDLVTAKSRRLLVNRYSKFAGQQLYVPEYDTPRDWVIGFVEGCVELDGGVSALVETVRFLRPDSAVVTDLRRLLDEWNAVDVAASAPDGVWDALRAELGAVPSRKAGNAYRATRLGAHPPAHCDNAWHLLLHAAARHARSSELPPWIGFLVHCADFLAPITQVRVEQWQQKFAHSTELTASLQEKRLGVSRELSRAELYLVIQFEHDVAVPGNYLMTWWHQWAGEPQFHQRGRRSVSPADLEGAANDAVTEVEVFFANESVDVVLEIILPFDLINEPVEVWLKRSDFGPAEFVMDYPVVIRSLDRLRRPETHRAWRLRWDTMRNHGVARPTPFVDVGEDGGMVSIDATIAADEAVTAMILSSPPEPPGGASLRAFKSALRCGLPVIAWHRSNEATPEDVMELRNIFRTGESLDLPRRVRAANLTRLQQSGHADGNWTPENGRRRTPSKIIALLCDDPRRQPEHAVAARGAVSVDAARAGETT